MFSDKNKYWNNTFINNGAGVAVMYSRIVEMWGNTFQHNWGDASFGLLLKDIYDSDIHDNLFEQNTIGLYSEGCSRIMVENNEFVDNGWAVKIMANSTDNEFRYNNFVRNTFDVATNSQQNFNLFESNYWSKYRGYDLDRDGVGDVPFHPVKLFSILVEKNEPALILLRSLFVNTLDIAEEYIPLMTPETLVDRQPLMERLP
jgi:nitrous oxidase accessory protein